MVSMQMLTGLTENHKAVSKRKALSGPVMICEGFVFVSAVAWSSPSSDENFKCFSEEDLTGTL